MQRFRLLWVFVNIGLGLLPSLAFFAWVERNASLPWVGIELGWPWIDFQSAAIPLLAIWNATLFLGFGLIHSLLAQSFIQKRLRSLLPVQAIRTFYIAVTGLSLTALMGLWQHTGIVLWTLPLSPGLLQGLSFALYWGFMAGAGRVMTRFDALEFVGLKQLYSSAREVDRPEGTPQLETHGIYGHVRHPIYTFTLLAFVVTPFMTLDRAILSAAALLYLTFAIPVEERKLIQLFGDDYARYRQKVPAIIPWIKPRA